MELTEKGIAVVNEMDKNYQSLCIEQGLDPEEWNPELWLEANKDVPLE